MGFLYYPGCTMSTTARELDRCARGVMAALGVALEEVPDWQCCGAVFSPAADDVATKLGVLRVLVHAVQVGQPVMTLCAACHHVFKQVNYQAKTSADFRAAVRAYDETLVYAGEAAIVHFTEVLRDYIGFDELQKKIVQPLKGRRIGAYYGCLLLRPAEIMGFDDAENPQIFENLIKALGATPVSFPLRNECCGGYRALEDTATCAAMVEKVTASAVSRGAETLVTACPLCLFQLVSYSGGEVDVCYFTELLAEALGLDDDADE